MRKWITGYEPYFNKNVYIGFLNHTTRTIYPCHGYFPPHPYSNKLRKLATKLKYEFNIK